MRLQNLVSCFQWYHGIFDSRGVVVGKQLLWELKQLIELYLWV